MKNSVAESLAYLNESDRDSLLRAMTNEELLAITNDWGFWARPNQLAPAGTWSIWVVMAGRGFGKTRTGAEWVRQRIKDGLAARIALIARTPADARDVMIEGQSSGLMAVHPDGEFPVPEYEPTKRRVSWFNEDNKRVALATVFSGETPDALRGPEHDTIWGDEFSTWRFATDCLDNALMGMRLGDDPRMALTTTPRPTSALRDLIASPHVVMTPGTSYDNRANLPEVFYTTVIQKYEGTTLGRQELMGLLLDEIPGALWSRALIDANRRPEADLPDKGDIQQIVVSIDPATTAGEKANETGIIVSGTRTEDDGERHGLILEDLSGRHSPRQWGEIAVGAYHHWGADVIVGETNQGGDLVEQNVKLIDTSVAFRKVVATRGKLVRAQPVVAKYEQGLVHHYGIFSRLEDQMVQFTGEGRGDSPDRMDALVWGQAYLLARPAGAGVSSEGVEGDDGENHMLYRPRTSIFGRRGW